METFVFVLTGGYGSGKTIMALSYHPKNNSNPKRLVIDKELRAVRYQSEEHGETKDVPEKLLYSFDLFNNDGIINIESFTNVIKRIKADNKPDVLIIDNVAMFQEDIEGMCQDAQGTRMVTDVLGITTKHDNFLKFRFNHDPYWRSVLKDILREFLLVVKRSGIDIIITTELRNEWQNYGSKGYDKDGKPLQRIIGKTAKVWDYVLQIADTCWILKRNVGKILDKPEISIDPLNPKLSIVGIPPVFTFNTWDEIWALEKNRGVPDKDDFNKVIVSEIEFIEGDQSELGDPNSTNPLESGKQRLIEELSNMYPNRRDIGEAIQKLGLTYTLDQHDNIKEQLLKYKSA